MPYQYPNLIIWDGLVNIALQVHIINYALHIGERHSRRFRTLSKQPQRGYVLEG